MTLGSRTADRPADFGRASKRNLVDVGVLHQRLTRRTIAGDNVDDSGRQCDLLANFGKGQRGERGELGGLQHRGISCGYCRRDFPRQHKQREIPGNYLSDHAACRVAWELSFKKLRPSRVMIEVAGHERNIDVAALTDRFPIVDCFENRKPARMSLDCAGHGIQMAGTGMRRERPPFWKRGSRRLNRGVDIRTRSLSDACNCFSGGRIDRIEEPAFGRLAPLPADEVTEAPMMLVEPEQHIFGVLWSGPVFHGEKFVRYTHSSRLASFPLCCVFAALTSSRCIITQSGGGSPPSTGRWRSVPTAVQCRSEVRSPRNGRGQPSSMEARVLPS